MERNKVKHPQLIRVLLIAIVVLIPLSAVGWFGYQNLQPEEPITTEIVSQKKVLDLPIQIATSIKGEMIPYFNEIARDEDVIGFTYGGVNRVGVEGFKKVVNQIKKGKVGFNEASWKKAQEDVPKLGGLIDYLSYDLENWKASGDEEKDIAGSSQKMQQIAHNNGLEYVGGLSYSLGKQPGTVEDAARYADEYAIWAQPFFKQGDLEGFVSYAREAADRARSSNPNIKIQLVVNVAWKGYTVQDILDKVITPSLDFIDSVAIYHLTGGQEAESRLKELVGLMR